MMFEFNRIPFYTLVKQIVPSDNKPFRIWWEPSDYYPERLDGMLANAIGNWVLQGWEFVDKSSRFVSVPRIGKGVFTSALKLVLPWVLSAKAEQSITYYGAKFQIRRQLTGDER